MLIRQVVSSLALCMSMIGTIHATGIQLALQKELIEQEQQKISDPIIKEDTSRQKSDYEQKIADAIPKDIKDWIEEFHQDIASAKPFVTLPKLIEVPEGIQELDMVRAVAQEMNVPVVYIDSNFLDKAYTYHDFPIHRRIDVANLIKGEHAHVALFIDAIETLEYMGQKSRYICDLLKAADRTKFITMLTTKAIDKVDPLIRGRIDRNFCMDPVVDVYDRQDLVSRFLEDELSTGQVYEKLVPFIVEHTKGFSPLDLDFLTTEIRATIKRAGIGPRGMPLDRAEILINVRKGEIERRIMVKNHPFVRFYKQHKFISCVIAPVVSLLGVGALIHYLKTHYKDIIVKKK